MLALGATWVITPRKLIMAVIRVPWPAACSCWFFIPFFFFFKERADGQALAFEWEPQILKLSSLSEMWQRAGNVHSQTHVKESFKFFHAVPSALYGEASIPLKAQPAMVPSPATPPALRSLGSNSFTHHFLLNIILSLFLGCTRNIQRIKTAHGLLFLGTNSFNHFTLWGYTPVKRVVELVLEIEKKRQ